MAVSVFDAQRRFGLLPLPVPRGQDVEEVRCAVTGVFAPITGIIGAIAGRRSPQAPSRRSAKASTGACCCSTGFRWSGDRSGWDATRIARSAALRATETLQRRAGPRILLARLGFLGLQPSRAATGARVLHRRLAESRSWRTGASARSRSTRRRWHGADVDGVRHHVLRCRHSQSLLEAGLDTVDEGVDACLQAIVFPTSASPIRTRVMPAFCAENPSSIETMAWTCLSPSDSSPMMRLMRPKIDDSDEFDQPLVHLRLAGEMPVQGGLRDFSAVPPWPRW